MGKIGIKNEACLLDEEELDDDEEKQKLKEDNRKLRRKLKLMELNAREEKAEMEKTIRRLKGHVKRAREEERSHKFQLVSVEENLETLLRERDAVSRKRGRKEYEAFIKKYCCVFPRNQDIFYKYPKFQELYRESLGAEYDTIRTLRAEIRRKDLIIENQVEIAQDGQNEKLVQKLHEKTEEAIKAQFETEKLAWNLVKYEPVVEYENKTIAHCDSSTDDYGNEVYVPPNVEDSEAEYDEEDVRDQIEGEEFEGEFDPDGDPDDVWQDFPY